MRKLILLADDSATVQQLVKLAFADEAIDIHCVPTTELARESLVQNTPQLILLDAKLPGGDPLVWVHSIRINPETSRIPIVILAPASAQLDPRLTGLVDQVIAKPFESISDLVTTSKELIEQKSLVIERRSLADLSRQSFGETDRSDIILEIEDIVDWPPTDSNANLRELINSLPAEALDALAEKVVALLIRRLRDRSASEEQIADLTRLLQSVDTIAADEHLKAPADIDEAGQNTDY